MAEKYTIPLGLDLNPATQDISSVLSTLDKVEEKAKTAGKTIEDSFGRGAKEADKLDEKLHQFNVELENVKEQGKQVGKELANAFNAKGVGKDFNNAVDGFRKKLEAISKTKISIDADTSKLKLLDTAIAESNGEIEALTQNIQIVKQALNELDPNSEEFKQLASAISFTETVFETFDEEVKQAVASGRNLHATFEEVYGDLQPMTTRLGEVEDRLYEMALAGQSNTEEFKALQQQAIAFRRTIQQVDSSVDTFAKRSAMIDIMVESATALTGAFTAVQGVTALMGAENEELEEALLKVNGAMAVLQGLQAVAQVLNKESAVSALLLRNNTVALTSATQAQTVATTAGTVATKAMGVTLKALGIGVIISLLVLLYENWDKVTASINKFLPAGASVGKIFDAIKSGAVGVGNAIFQFIATPFKAITSLISGDMEGFKQAFRDGLSFKKNFADGFNSQELRNQKEHNKKMEEEEVKRLERELARRKARGEDVTASEITLQKRKLAIYEKDSKDYKENLTKLEDLEDGHYKERQDKIKNDAKEAQKKRDEANKERLQKEKEANDQLKKFTQEAERIRINGIEDQFEKQREQIQLDYDTRKKELEKELALSKEAEQKKTELLKALESDRARQIAEVNKEELEQKIELQAQANSILVDLMKQGLQQELAYLKIDSEERIKEISELYKNDEETRIKLITAIEQNVARETARIKTEFAKEELENEEERQLLAIELLDKYAIKNEKNERAKQIAILQTKSEYAQKALDLLISSGESENSLEVLQAKASIKKIKEELANEIKKNDGAGFDLLDFLGFGDLDEEQRQKLKDAGKQIGDNLKVVTDFLVSQYDRQIEKKQEVIDQLDDEIDDLEKRLETERGLQEKGLANNVELIQKDLEEKKRQKDEEIKQQEELTQKKIQLQKVQMAVDTASQLVNMITASTAIFKSLAGIPFVGVPTAIALIATMFGAFTATKIKAYQAINEGAKFRNGGWIDGRSHEQGGVKYYSADGNNIELEGNEFVIRKNKAKKYGSVLEALNDDNFPTNRINQSELIQVLERLGISMLPTDGNETLRQASQNVKLIVKNDGNNMSLSEIERHLSFLANQKREETNSWEDDLYIYIKKGSKTTKIKKKNATEI